MFQKIKKYFNQRLKPKKISIKKILLNKNNFFIFFNLNQNVVEKENVINFINSNKKDILFIDRVDFKMWFKENKKKDIRYILLNNNMHIKYEYRWIRDNGFISYLIK